MAHQESFLPRSLIGLLSVSGLLQPGNESTSFSQLAPCFYHEWIYLRFLARVDEVAVLSGSAHFEVRLRMRSFRLLFIGLGSAWIPRLLCGGLRRSNRIFSGGGATSGSSLSARSGGCLPSSTCGPTLPMSVGLSSQPFSGFRVDPEPISVSAASVKAAVSINLFAITLFHCCLPYFSLFHDPNALRTEVLLQPWNGWQAYAFPPYALLSAIL